MGEELDSLALSYFDFMLINNDTEYQIKYYTGPTEDLTELVIPKSFGGKPVTALGTEIYDPASTKCRIVPQNTPGFVLVLNENITEIKDYSFYSVQVTGVEGDTSHLNTIGSYAFSWADSGNIYMLDIRLDYPGKIAVGRSIFNHMNVTARIKHATSFSRTFLETQSIDYIFTDAHTYGQPQWTWADDYSTATAKFTCTDSRCKHEESTEATVTNQTADDIITYTATAGLDGKTYTDIKSVDRTYFARHSLTLNGDIGVNFYLWLTQEELAENPAVNFTLNGEALSTYTIDAARDVKTVDGMTLYKATCQVCAPEMADMITATLSIGGEEVKTETYSVKTYADAICADENQPEDLKALVSTMLNYGAAAQYQFVDEHPDNSIMANDDVDYDLVPLTDAQISAISTQIPDKDAIK